MKRPTRKTLLLSLIVIVLVGAGGAAFLKSRMQGEPAANAAADSTAAGDSTSARQDVAKNDDKKNKKGDDKDKEDKPVPVEAASASTRSISTFYQTTATLEPEKRVDILSKLAGEVAQIVAEEGDFVKQGTLLCRLDDKEFKVALEEARINRDKQKLEFDRIESMHQQSLISDKEYADGKYQYEVAVNRYESAQMKYEYTRIRAPFSGVVTQRLVDPGENIPIGAKLYMLSDTQPLLLAMYLPESQARAVRKGQTVYIRPDAAPDTQFEGEILRIAPEVDQRTGTIKVTAQTRGSGVPGSFVRVRILTDTHENVLAVPRRSIVADAGDRFVFVAAADTIRRVEVAVGYEDDTYAEIKTGLAAGDKVVTAGVGGIRDGTKIKIVDAGKAEQAARE